MQSFLVHFLLSSIIFGAVATTAGVVCVCVCVCTCARGHLVNGDFVHS